MPFRPLLARLFLAFSLLLLQQGAIAHALEHLNERSQDGDVGALHDCNLCHAYAATAHAAVDAAPHADFPLVFDDLPFEQIYFFAAPSLLAADARGPPAPL